MKKHIDQLSRISNLPARYIIGLMSGTSLDGLDVALCRFEGAGKQTKVEVVRFATLPYDAHFKSEIRRVFAKKEIDFQHFTLLNVLIAERHSALVSQCLNEWKIQAEEVDLIASHGQTVFHAPRIFHGLPEYPNATLQIGDGDHIARRTGIITVSDFRQKHVAAGGEGAPLALYGDYLLFSQPGEDRFLLNIGGIANFTFLPGDGDTTRAFATDTGPGNTLLDAFARELFGVPFDENARIASNGRVDSLLLEILRRDPFFEKPFPKTIGPELFSTAWVQSALQQLPKGNVNPFDLLATLTRLTAETVAESILRVPGIAAPSRVYLSGGGAHNPLIIKYLEELLPAWQLLPMEKLGVHGDAKEAVLFAALANETVAGTYISGSMLGGIPLVGMGKISFPD
ncbi:MAG TPA: anhydro-N-acetylmuramic acid kinase [Saprospiraceae bacterium]|nr:anhydro-N-acetylmuramic acid kinase [Saprospiraceae bacterium]